ncbi:MAG: hypothetical protein WA066_07575 [Candidatus Omnitrophota bacterium]
MRKGRITKEEQGRRIKLLLRFIFTFKYATRKQLDMFIQTIMNMTYTRRFIAYSLRKGYLKACYEPLYKTKIYYLAQKGTDFIYEEECLANVGNKQSDTKNNNGGSMGKKFKIQFLPEIIFYKPS